jgi:hypothetical protein
MKNDQFYRIQQSPDLKPNPRQDVNISVNDLLEPPSKKYLNLTHIDYLLTKRKLLFLFLDAAFLCSQCYSPCS